MRDFFAELRTRNGPLYWFGWLQVALTVIALILYFLDPRDEGRVQEIQDQCNYGQCDLKPTEPVQRSVSCS